MIHKFKSNGIYICYDVESGSLFEIDELAYNLLGVNDYIKKEERKKLLDRYSQDEIDETLEELESLKKEGLLYAKPAQVNILPKENFQVKALCLHIAHDCNLRCRYCFAGTGDFNGERSFMSLETAKKAVDFVVESSGNRHNIEIDFFGGEPLLNFDVVKQTVEYARSLESKYNKHFKFTMTTNGVLLNDEIADWLNENMDNIVLSHDGRRDVNDKMRKNLAGSGSYDMITPKILNMVERRDKSKDYYVRGTYTHENLDFSEDVKHFYDLGIDSISIEPVVAGQDEDYRLRDEDLDVLKDEYEKLARYNLENDFSFFHFNIDFDGGPCLYKRVSGCGAGVDYLAVTPEGSIFPCHQFVSRPEYYLGNLDQGIIHPEKMQQFAMANLFNKESCKNCWCRYICGGGCHANSIEFNQDLNKPYELACKLEQMRVEAAMMLTIKKLKN